MESDKYWIVLLYPLLCLLSILAWAAYAMYRKRRFTLHLRFLGLTFNLTNEVPNELYPEEAVPANDHSRTR